MGIEPTSSIPQVCVNLLVVPYQFGRIWAQKSGRKPRGERPGDLCLHAPFTLAMLVRES